jgi:hypothetical protein
MRWSSRVVDPALQGVQVTGSYTTPEDSNYEPNELRYLLRHQRWTASIDATSWFIFGAAEPVGNRQ